MWHEVSTFRSSHSSFLNIFYIDSCIMYISAPSERSLPFKIHAFLHDFPPQDIRTSGASDEEETSSTQASSSSGDLLQRYRGRGRGHALHQLPAPLDFFRSSKPKTGHVTSDIYEWLYNIGVEIV